jgi:hypothetical protein
MKMKGTPERPELLSVLVKTQLTDWWLSAKMISASANSATPITCQ